MGVNIKQVMLSLASSRKVIFAAEPIVNDEEIQPFPMILKWVLNYHKFWTCYPSTWFPHTWLHFVCSWKYRSTKQLHKSLDLLKPTLTLCVLQVNVWPWMFLGCVKNENLYLCAVYLIFHLSKLQCTHKARDRREVLFQEMQITHAIYISLQSKCHNPQV